MTRDEQMTYARHLMGAGAGLMVELVGVLKTIQELEGVASALVASRKEQITAEVEAIKTEGNA